MQEIRLTNHVVQRGNERMNVKTTTKLSRIAYLAWTRGTSRDTAPKAAQRRILEAVDGRIEGTSARLFNGFIFIFIEGEQEMVSLVTVYPCRKEYEYDTRKIRVRNRRKYIRMNPTLAM